MIIFFQKKMLIIENNPYYFKSIASNNYFKMVVKSSGRIKISKNKSGKEGMVGIILLGLGCFCFFGTIRFHQSTHQLHKIDNNKRKKNSTTHQN